MNSKKWLVTHKLWGLTAEKSGEKGCKTYNWKFVSKTPKTELFCYFNPDACIQYSNVQNDAQINATREPGQEIFLGFCSKIGKFLPSQVPGGLWLSGIIFPILQASYFDLCRQISLGDWEGYYLPRGGVKFHPRVNILQMILISILHNVTTFKNKYCMTAKLTLELPRINTQCLSIEVFWEE